MHILFLADAVFEDLPGGSRVAARELARGLVARGHNVTFLVARQTPDAPDDARDGGIRIIRYPGAGSPLAFVREGRRACRRLWAEQTFDIVHTHFAYAAWGPSQALPPGTPRIRTFHGPWDEEGWVEDTAHAPGAVPRLKATLKKALRQRVERQSLTRSDRVLTLSDCFRQKVIEDYGIPAERVQTIPGGTDTARFQPAPDKAAVRRALGLPEGRPLLLSVRRLAPRMGLDNLIAALPAVVARFPDTLLLLGGTGPEKDRLAQMIRERRLEDHARLIGFIPDAQLAAYYQAADLFVLPTVALEGFGLVTIEALACGLPVLGTNTGATPEILTRLDPRLIVPGVTPDTLAAAILRFLEQEWAKELTPDRLRRFVLDHYQWDRHVAAVEQSYQELTGTGARPSAFADCALEE